MPEKKDIPVIAFATQKNFERWLSKNHGKEEGIWLQFFKKDSEVKTISYSQALDEALCYGWIDGQVKKYDSKSWIQKFTPRRKRSTWSKRNRGHVARLKKEGRMKPPGLEKVKEAKADGRWKSAYDSPAKMKIPEDFIKKLSRFKKAEAFFGTLNKANLYAIAWRLQTAKRPETRERRMKVFLEMLKKGKKIHE